MSALPMSGPEFGTEPRNVDAWYWPNCGYMHYERNPKRIPWECPNRVPHRKNDPKSLTETANTSWTR